MYAEKVEQEDASYSFLMNTVTQLLMEDNRTFDYIHRTDPAGRT